MIKFSVRLSSPSPSYILNLLYYLSVVLAWYLMTGLFFCNLLVTSDSGLSPPTLCLVSLFHTSQRFHQCPGPTRYWPLLQLEFVLFSYWLWKENKTVLLYRRLWKWPRQELIYSVPKGLLNRWSGVDFLKICLTQSLIKHLSPSEPRELILPLNFLVSLAICYYIQCLPVWAQNDLRETSQNLGTPWSLTSFQDIKKDETLVRKWDYKSSNPKWVTGVRRVKLATRQLPAMQPVANETLE